MYKRTNSPSGMFAALDVNASVHVLRIGARSIDESCGDTLPLALSKNACLRDLDLTAAVADACMVRLAEALSHNTRLEKLQFTSAELSAYGALALCDALGANTTLKELVFPTFVAFETESRRKEANFHFCYISSVLEFLLVWKSCCY